MDTEIGEGPAVSAAAGVDIARSQEDQIPGALKVAVVVDREQLLSFKHIIEFILGMGVLRIIPFPAHLAQMHAEQVERGFHIRDNRFTKALPRDRRFKSCNQ